MRQLWTGLLAGLLVISVASADWQSVDSGIPGRVWSVSTPSADVIYACTDQGEVWKSSDGAATWTMIQEADFQDYRGIDFSDEMNGTVASAGGNVYATSDGGSTWSTPLDGWWISHNDVTMPSGNDIAYVAGKNTINQPLVTFTTNGWSSWDQWSFLIVINDVGNEGQIVGFAVTDDAMIAACRTWTGEGAIVISTDGGSTWTTTYTGNNAVMDVAANDEVAIAVTLGGVILRSTDAGQSWESVANAGSSLNDICLVNNNDAWAVGEGGTIYGSQNGGQTWQPATSPVNTTLQAIDCTAAGFAVATGDNGTVVVYDPGPPAPVSFDLFATNDFVPETGGTVTYDIALTSTLPYGIPGVTYWTTVDAPNGSSYGPLLQQGFTLAPFMDVYLTGASQNVPGFAPDGVYVFNGHIGFFPDASLTSSFEFIKGGEGTDSASSGPVDNWDGSLPLDQAREALQR